MNSREDPLVNKFALSIDEPISFIEGWTSDYDGTYELMFEDNSTNRWELDLENGNGKLILQCNDVRMHPKPSGVAEKTIVGILTRWCESDPDVKLLMGGKYNARDLKGRSVALAILAELEQRN